MSRSAAETYHESTKYSEHGLSRTAQELDWDKKPDVFKTYHAENRIALSDYLPFERNPFTGEPPAPTLEDKPGTACAPVLGRILYYTYGITAVIQYPAVGPQFLRAAPSAGALYPTEFYAATRGVAGVPDGIHNYSVRDQSLVPLWEGDFWPDLRRATFDHPAVDRSRIVVLAAGVFHRSSWRYQERGYRRVLLDTGHALGNLCAAAPLEGFQAWPIGGFRDESLNGLCFFDGREEGILAVVPLTEASTPPEAAAPATHRFPSAPPPPGDYPEDEKLFQRLHRASSVSAREAARPAAADAWERLDALHAGGGDLALPSAELEVGARLKEIVVRRRSTRKFTGDPFTLDELAAALDFAARPMRAQRAGEGPPALFDPSRLETYVVVNAVEGLAAGTYLAASDARSLRRLKTGDFKAEALHACLGQELGRDAAAVVVHAADLGQGVAACGDRVYRYLHMDAGHLGQRLNLAAVAMNLGASGIGGFYDDELNALLGLGPEKIIVYVTTLGKPA